MDQNGHRREKMQHGLLNPSIDKEPVISINVKGYRGEDGGFETEHNYHRNSMNHNLTAKNKRNIQDNRSVNFSPEIRMAIEN